MNKRNLYTCSERKVNSDYFNGSVVIKDVLPNGDNSQDQELLFCRVFKWGPDDNAFS